ncbi:MAG: hypothetical protein ACI9U2_000102 [Bradymonadia bacterium]|jgi:hypothetical protein
MKPVQLIAILGGLLITGVIGWYFYMEANPFYEDTPVRGLNLPAASAKAPQSAKAKEPAPISAAPVSEASAP